MTSVSGDNQFSATTIQQELRERLEEEEKVFEQLNSDDLLLVIELDDDDDDLHAPTHDIYTTE
jgi:hypothetical protein